MGRRLVAAGVVCLILGLFGLIGQLMDEAAASPDPDGIVAYWRFDEGSGNTAYDETANNNDGTIYGATWVDGISGKALSFDGVDDYVEVPYDPSLDFDALTWAAWVKVDDTSDARGIVGKAWTVEYPGEWYSSIMPPTSKVYFVTLTNSGRVDLFGNTTLSTGTWYHVAGTYDGATMKIYVNGVEDGSASQSGSLHLDMTLLIGRRGRVGVFDGVIDEVHIYNRALSPDEILQHYLGRGLLLTSLIISDENFTLQDGKSKYLTTTLISGGSPVANKLITWSATAGTIAPSSGKTDTAGQVTVVYTAPSYETHVIVSASYVGSEQYESSSVNSYGTIAEPSTGISMELVIGIPIVIGCAIVGAALYMRRRKPTEFRW